MNSTALQVSGWPSAGSGATRRFCRSNLRCLTTKAEKEVWFSFLSVHILKQNTVHTSCYIFLILGAL
jgi:hypothetical protein